MVVSGVTSIVYGRGASLRHTFMNEHGVRLEFGVEEDGMVEATLEGPESGCLEVRKQLENLSKDLVFFSTYSACDC